MPGEVRKTAQLAPSARYAARGNLVGRSLTIQECTDGQTTMVQALRLIPSYPELEHVYAELDRLIDRTTATHRESRANHRSHTIRGYRDGMRLLPQAHRGGH